MKFEVRDILLVILSALMVWQIFFNEKEEKPPEPITITIPEKTGTSGLQTIERVQQVPVYIPQYKEPVQVDSYYKKLYEESKDSIERMNLYLQAIKINDYDSTIVDNDTIKIDAFAKTRGSLLEYKVDYKIKPDAFTYTPQIDYRRPRLSAGFGVEGGIPTRPETNFLLKGNLYFENRKGNGFSLGYDTDNRVWLGVRKTFTLKK